MSLLINHFYRFGEFTLDTDQKVLLREGKPLALTPKVFDTLLILVEHSGRIVTKEELMDRVWPDSFVEETNLAFNVKQLRKSLHDDARHPRYIETVARRGYRFIADVEEVLSDTGLRGDHIAQRIEPADAHSPDAAGAIESPAESPKPEPAIVLTGESQPVVPEQHPDARPVAGAAPTRISKKAIALAAAMAILLAGVGIVIWKVSTKSSGENPAGGGRPPASPLKLEKLTQTGNSRYVAISPDGRYIAYTRAVEKKRGIWLRQLAANTNIEIVPATGPERIHGLAFANSGEYLYFVKGTPAALFRVSSLGGAPTKILDNLEGNFAVSADDGQIAFLRVVYKPDGQREMSLLVANADGTQERTLLTTVHPDSLNVPAWAPDGASIICAYYSPGGGRHGAHLVAVSLADGTKKDLTSESFFSIGQMAWLPDKSGLIMSARKTHEGDNQLWRVSYPGLEARQLSDGLTHFIDLSVASAGDRAAATQGARTNHLWVGSSREPEHLKKIVRGALYFCWTPDGQLVYSSRASGNTDLWIMQPDGSGEKQLTANPATDGSPAVTPDGRHIVFVSNRTGAYELWRMNLDGSDLIQLTTGGGISPAISPDGKWVVYNTPNWHLWKVPIDGGEPIRIAEHVARFPAVSPDGKMIACTGSEGQRQQYHWILVLPVAGGPPLKRMEFAGGIWWGVRMQWTADGRALIFGLDRNGERVLVKQPLDGGRPEVILAFDEDEPFDFGYSPDGQHFAVTRGEWQHDIVLISDLNRH